jgi:hypothetical protein
MDSHFFFLLPPQVTPGTLSSTPRQVRRVKMFDPRGIELSTFRLAKHTPALGSSGGRHRIPEGSRGRNSDGVDGGDNLEVAVVGGPREDPGGVPGSTLQQAL